MLAPIDTRLNIAVLHICSRLYPTGFDTVDDEAAAPSTLKALLSHVERTGRMVVWSGASEDTIFGSADINHAFRAWHDWCHWRYELPFNEVGERKAAYVQVAQLMRLFGDVADWPEIILTEVVGQTRFNEAWGHFPQHQRDFMALCRPAYRAEADRLVLMLGQRNDDKAALFYANLH